MLHTSINRVWLRLMKINDMILQTRVVQLLTEIKAGVLHGSVHLIQCCWAGIVGCWGWKQTGCPWKLCETSPYHICYWGDYVRSRNDWVLDRTSLVNWCCMCTHHGYMQYLAFRTHDGYSVSYTWGILIKTRYMIQICTWTHTIYTYVKHMFQHTIAN